MRMLLLFENGPRVEAIVLAGGRNRMRVAIRGAKDAMELRLLKDQWMSDEGEAVDIESVFLQGESVGEPQVRGSAA